MITTPVAGPVADPSLARLIKVELRKCVDTRAGRWLLIVIAIDNTSVAALQVIFAPAAEQSFREFLDGQQLGTYFLLPIVGILAVTSEWSTRSAMTTFTLVPKRHRIAIAKIGATSLLALLVGVVTEMITLSATSRRGSTSTQRSSRSRARERPASCGPTWQLPWPSGWRCRPRSGSGGWPVERSPDPISERARPSR